MKVVVAKQILKANDQIAAGNRARFDSAGIYAVNVLGSPGAGKTSLLESLAQHLAGRVKPAAIEGDLATSRDAERIQALGWPTLQINTDGGCHLDANMVAAGLGEIDLAQVELLFIDNVGNLVCTASYQLGERLRLVVLSITEGDEKIVKYPPMFQRADAIVFNKIDLLPHTDFDVQRARDDALHLKPDLDFFEVSARTGEGVAELAGWLVGKRQEWLTGTVRD